jgi:hypothetical protein
VPVVFLIAVIVVLAGVFLAATGRGGELAYERVDHAPLDLGPVSAPDVAMLRPPTAMWGYNMQVTDEALDRIARAMRERDVTIAYLQQQLANRVSADPGAPQLHHAAEPTVVSEAFRVAEPPAVSEAFRVAEPPAVSEAFRVAEPPVVSEALPEAGPPASEALPVTGPPTSEALVAAENPDAPQRPRTKAPGVLVAPLPPKATQPSATAPSPEAPRPAQATQPSQTLPGSYEALGPQGAYDAHGWWAQQEEAAREEEARRQAAAQEAGQALPSQADPPETSLPEASALEADPPEVSALDASALDASALEADPSEADSPSGRTETVPNPVITSPDGTATPSGHGDQPTASSVPPVPPDDDPDNDPDDETVAAAEEQAW